MKGEINMRFKDERTDNVINFKLTTREKERLKEAAAAREMNISDFVRYACERIFEQDEKNFGQN